MFFLLFQTVLLLMSLFSDSNFLVEMF